MVKSTISTIIPYLVGGFNHLEKYEFVNGKDDMPSLKWKIKHVRNHQPVDISSFPNLIQQSFLGLPILGQGLSDNKKSSLRSTG